MKYQKFNFWPHLKLAKLETIIGQCQFPLEVMALHYSGDNMNTRHQVEKGAVVSFSRAKVLTACM